MASTDEGGRILLLGGIGGLLAGILNLVGQIVAVFFAPAPLRTPEETLAAFLAFRAATVLAARLFYVSAMLFIPLALALYHVLKRGRPASALVGAVFGVVGAALVVVWTLVLYNAVADLAQLYATAAAGDQFAVLAAATAVIGITAGLVVAGFFFLGISFLSFGVAILGSRDIQRGYGWASVVLGIATVSVPFTSGFIPLLIGPWAIFSLALGWRVLSLSTGAEKGSKGSGDPLNSKET